MCEPPPPTSTGAAKPPTKAACAMTFASCDTARAIIASTKATITTNATPEPISACSFAAASVVRYITPKPKPCKVRPYSRFLLCSFTPAPAAATPAPNTAR